MAAPTSAGAAIRPGSADAEAPILARTPAAVVATASMAWILAVAAAAATAAAVGMWEVEGRGAACRGRGEGRGVCEDLVQGTNNLEFTTLVYVWKVIFIEIKKKNGLESLSVFSLS